MITLPRDKTTNPEISYGVVIEAPHRVVWSFVEQLDKLHQWYPLGPWSGGNRLGLDLLTQGQELDHGFQATVRGPLFLTQLDLWQAGRGPHWYLRVHQVDPERKVEFLLLTPSRNAIWGRDVIMLEEDGPQSCLVTLNAKGYRPRWREITHNLLTLGLYEILDRLATGRWPFSHRSRLYKLKRLVEQDNQRV